MEVIMFSSYDLNEFGKSLRALRKNNRMTQKDVSAYVGINEDTLRRIENGYVIPKYETLEILSQLYKSDLLELLKKHRNNTYLSDFYERFDTLTNKNDIAGLQALSEEINEEESIPCNLLVSENEFNLLKILVHQSVLFQSSNYDTSEEMINKLVNALVQTIPNFVIEKFDTYKYNLLEIRVLMLIGFSYKYISNIKLSNSIFIFCANYLISEPTSSMSSIHLITKLYHCISYSFHTLSNHKSALEYAIKGIEYARLYSSSYLVAHLYARKGAAEFYLDDFEYKKSLKTSVWLLEIEGSFDLANTYRDVISSTYGLNIEKF
jgi:transcriptional regulator with XRE-family HTH domain